MAVETKVFKCTNCQSEVMVEIPQYEIINTMYTSLVIFSHAKPDVCNSCGQGFLFAIDKAAGVKAVFGWIPVQIEAANKASNIVLPPGGVDFSKIKH